MPAGARPNRCEDTRGIVAEDGEIQAICVLDNWSANSCMIHIWINNPFVLKYGFAETIFEYVFGGGRNKIIGLTPSDNPKALKFIKHIGFVEKYRIRDGYAVGVDFVLTEFTSEDFAKWERKAHRIPLTMKQPQLLKVRQTDRVQ
jgi:RimJ/RimL family protein N-acetyltransferase